MSKLIGVWHIDIELLTLPLKVYAGFLMAGFCLGLMILIIGAIIQEYNEKQIFLISLVPSICFLIGMANLAVFWVVITVYIVTIISYNFYWWLDAYKEFNRYAAGQNSTNMDFQTFKNLYDLNPDRFNYVSYGGCWEYVYKNSEHPWLFEKIYISITDHKEFAKYYKWNKQRLKQEAKDKAIADRAKRHRAYVKNMQLILNQAQMDIDVLKKQADEEIAMAADISKQVKERM